MEIILKMINSFVNTYGWHIRRIVFEECSEYGIPKKNHYYATVFVDDEYHRYMKYCFYESGNFELVGEIF